MPSTISQVEPIVRLHPSLTSFPEPISGISFVTLLDCGTFVDRELFLCLLHHENCFRNRFVLKIGISIPFITTIMFKLWMDLAASYAMTGCVLSLPMQSISHLYMLYSPILEIGQHVSTCANSTTALPASKSACRQMSHDCWHHPRKSAPITFWAPRLENKEETLRINVGRPKCLSNVPNWHAWLWWRKSSWLLVVEWLIFRNLRLVGNGNFEN